MIELWRVKYNFNIRIEKVIAAKATNKSVFLKRGRVARDSDGTTYCDSFGEARTFAELKLQRSIRQAETDLANYRKTLLEVQALHPENVPVTESQY